MQQLLACCLKEFTILRRDKMGLILLFVLPLIFLLIITLVQANAIGSQQRLTILLIDESQTDIAENLQTEVAKSHFFILQQCLDDKPATQTQARTRVAQGKNPALIVISPSINDYFVGKYKEQLTGLTDDETTTYLIKIVFDPNINPAVRHAIETTIALFIQQAQLSASAQVVSEVLATPTHWPPTASELIHAEFAYEGDYFIQPNVVQQNVPAWAIFGMFFIAIPMAGGFIRERALGVLARTYVSLTSYYIVLSGKIIAFSLVNLLQLALMLLMGLTVLPWLGLPTLDFGPHLYLILIVGLATALAATGFGILLGAMTKTYEQVSTIGSMSVVTAAAIGGIMVPTYLMPAIIQALSWLSPMRWSHDAFIELFVRGAGFSAILPQLLLLLLFFVGTLIIAVKFLLRRHD